MKRRKLSIHVIMYNRIRVDKTVQYILKHVIF